MVPIEELYKTSHSPPRQRSLPHASDSLAGLPQRLKKLRTDHNLSQKQVSQILGIKRESVSQYELGKREISLEILDSYARIFGLSLDELVYGSNPGCFDRTLLAECPS